jgi:hypothetical protein
MNPNSIRAHVAFSFKAEMHELDSTLDLDDLLGDSGEEPNFHLILARAAGIDPYSYLYEVLESHEIEFLDPTGIAVQCWRDGHFDWGQFVRNRREGQGIKAVKAIAEQVLGIHDLDQHADLKAALLAAYQAGEQAP